MPIWGGTDYTGRIQNFELQLRAEGKYLFSEDGEPGFTKDEPRRVLGAGRRRRATASASPQQRSRGGLPRRGLRRRAHRRAS